MTNIKISKSILVELTEIAAFHAKYLHMSKTNFEGQGIDSDVAEILVKDQRTVIDASVSSLIRVHAYSHVLENVTAGDYSDHPAKYDNQVHAIAAELRAQYKTCLDKLLEESK